MCLLLFFISQHIRNHPIKNIYCSLFFLLYHCREQMKIERKLKEKNTCETFDMLISDLSDHEISKTVRLRLL